MEKLSLWVVAFLLALIVPTHLSIDFFGIRLSMYRAILLLGAVFIVKEYFGLRDKLLAVDALVLLASILMFAAMVINNGQAGVAFGASIILETCGPYFLARAFVRSDAHFDKFGKIFLITLSLIVLPVIYEGVTGNNLFGIDKAGDLGQRIGLHRAFGPMDHPIILGLFAASGISIGYASLQSKSRKGFYLSALISTLMSVSSAAFLMAAIQFVLLRFKTLASAKLSSYGLILASLYIVIAIFSNRTPLAVFASYLSLDQHTAHFRILIYEYATENIVQSPFLGIGLNDWARPEWMSASIDSFYFVVALRYGLPVLLCVCLILFQALKATYVAPVTRLHLGYRILLMSILISIFTVHIWNSMYVFFWFIVGVCVNLQFIQRVVDVDAGDDGLAGIKAGK